ncbi:hypothetical protein CG51_11170 [Haematobacter missouriensis]|nr:hypothetical protein CG51_11170 [Haematobacter missouriensis]
MSFFSKGFLEQLGLHAQVGEHALQPPILVFKSSSAFIGLIIEASMPPYFERHLEKLAMLIPCSRHSSGTATPLSARRSSQVLRLGETAFSHSKLLNSRLMKKFYLCSPLTMGMITPKAYHRRKIESFELS